MKQVKIAAFLGYGSKIQRYIDEPGLNDRTFNSIRELAKKYSLTNIKKTDKKEWAVSGRGNTIEWFVYTALMPDTNNNQPQPKDESKEDEFIELDVPIKTPLWEDDESKEVKEGFTGGEWQVSKDGYDIEAVYGDGDKTGICAMYAYEKSTNDAALISQAKNMYLGIKSFLKRLNDFPSKGMSIEEISLLAAIDVMAEDMFLPILQKANPQG